MAIKMVRQPSETPNIRNIDDIVGLRYAYGNQDGYVVGKGTELSYSVNGSTFTLNSGRVVLQGVESDIDANGVSFSVDNVSELRYFTVYYKVNLASNTTSIELSNFDTAGFPTIALGDDLTEVSSGTANLPLYHFTVRNGIIGNVEKIVKPLSYINDEHIKNVKVKNSDHSTESDNSVNAQYALYASSDKSKGTIEERLTALGFKEGTINFGSAVASVGSSTLIKSGRLVVIQASSITLNNYSLGTFSIPKEFAPKERTSLAMSRSIGLGVYYLYVNPDGSIECTKMSDPNGKDYFRIATSYWLQ